MCEGVEGGNGGGGEVTVERAACLTEAFTAPYDYGRVRSAGLYDDAGFCGECGKPYCRRHWCVRSGYGYCPDGHGKSLDPDWSPAD